MQCDLAIPQVTQIQRKHMSIQKLYMITHSSFICNYQKLKLVQMSMVNWMNKQLWYKYTSPFPPPESYSEVKQTIVAGNNMHESQNNYAYWKKLQTKEI